MKLYDHQAKALEETKDLDHVAYYHDQGLGKTFTGAEKMMQLGAKVNLVVCQKSKIDDWIEHFINNYDHDNSIAIDLTNSTGMELFFNDAIGARKIGIINYDLVFRRPKLLQLKDFTLMLDESSLIQNETAKRSKFILKMQPKNVILLSGTPTGGKYEYLWSQMKLLGWNISKKLYWKQYVDTEVLDNEGYPITIVKGYKNVERLKRKMRQYGCNFLKTEDCIDLPEQIDQTIRIPTTKEYRKFRKDRIITVGGHWVDYCDESGHMQREFRGGTELVGDTTLTKMLYERQLCGQYNKSKLEAFRDLVESTSDRLIVFYNFNAEVDALKAVIPDGRWFGCVNGKEKDLLAYREVSDSITFIQYQAGAMGLNLQLANRIVYFTPPLSSELFEQSKKRIHRIGQHKTCFYYYLTCYDSVEEKIYQTLAMRRDYTEQLFVEGD